MKNLMMTSIAALALAACGGTSESDLDSAYDGGGEAAVEMVEGAPEPVTEIVETPITETALPEPMENGEAIVGEVVELTSEDAIEAGETLGVLEETVVEITDEAVEAAGEPPTEDTAEAVAPETSTTLEDVATGAPEGVTDETADAMPDADTASEMLEKAEETAEDAVSDVVEEVTETVEETVEDVVEETTEADTPQ